MKSRDEMIKAVKNRIKQIDESLEVIPFTNSSYWRQEAVREELQTFLDWVKGGTGGQWMDEGQHRMIQFACIGLQGGILALISLMSSGLWYWIFGLVGWPMLLFFIFSMTTRIAELGDALSWIQED